LFVPEPPWTQNNGVQSVVEAWRASGSIRRCFTAERALPPANPSFAAIPPALHESLHRALRQRGIAQLYTHQVQAVDAALSGQHVVVATPTASGKSLCFHLPVLHALIEDPQATALFIYPTKALSRDQEHNLRELMKDSELSSGAMVYDGDTPADARRAARERCRVVLTNPDMLHAGTSSLSALGALGALGALAALGPLHALGGLLGAATRSAHDAGVRRQSSVTPKAGCSVTCCLTINPTSQGLTCASQA